MMSAIGKPMTRRRIISRTTQFGISKNGKICIKFPNGAKAFEPVTVEFTSTMSWLPLGSTVAKALQGVTNVQVKGTATMRLEQTPTEVAVGCA